MKLGKFKVPALIILLVIITGFVSVVATISILNRRDNTALPVVTPNTAQAQFLLAEPATTVVTSEMAGPTEVAPKKLETTNEVDADAILARYKLAKAAVAKNPELGGRPVFTEKFKYEEKGR